MDRTLHELQTPDKPRASHTVRVSGCSALALRARRPTMVPFEADGSASRSSAAAPATCGADMLVPLLST